MAPAGHWQAAKSSDEYSLAGCTLAPGFEFSDFRMFKDLPEMAARIYAEYPELGRYF